MSDILAALRTHLIGSSGVSSLVGTRIYVDVAPQGAANPAIVITEVAGLRQQHMEGSSGLVDGRYQLDCYADRRKQAFDLSEAVRNRLDGIRCVTVSGVEIASVMLTSRRADFLDPHASTEINEFRKTLEFDIWYREPIPTGT